MTLYVRTPLFVGSALGLTLAALAKFQETVPCLQVRLTKIQDCNVNLVKLHLANRGGPMVVVSQAFSANNEKHSSLDTVIKPRGKLQGWTRPIGELGPSREVEVTEIWTKTRSRHKSSHKPSDNTSDKPSDDLCSLLKKSNVQFYVEYKYCYVPYLGCVLNGQACFDLV